MKKRFTDWNTKMVGVKTIAVSEYSKYMKVKVKSLSKSLGVSDLELLDLLLTDLLKK